MLRDPSLIPLSHDHQHALGLCVKVRRGLTTQTPEQLANLVLSLFDSEIRGHFECEETVLFPAANEIESNRDLVRELVAEHRRLEGMVATLRLRADVEVLSAFAELLTQHVRKEEGVLFENIQKQLSREELDRLGVIFAERTEASVCPTDPVREAPLPSPVHDPDEPPAGR